MCRMTVPGGHRCGWSPAVPTIAAVANDGNQRPVPLLEHALLVGDPSYGQLILVRHGQQASNDLNDPHRSKGGDPPLSDLGLRQAEAAADELAGEPLEAVYCSHIIRAATTARAIAARHGLEPVVDPGLAEVGVYRDIPAGRTVLDEIGESGIAEVRRKFMAHRRWDAFPMTETTVEVEARVLPAIERIRDAHGDSSRVAVVCHGGVINIVLRRVLGVDADMFFYPAHASISRLGRGDGRMMVRTLNEDGHLRRSPDVAVTY